jgi:hypothetical protein
MVDRPNSHREKSVQAACFMRGIQLWPAPGGGDAYSLILKSSGDGYDKVLLRNRPLAECENALRAYPPMAAKRHHWHH